MPGIYWWCCCKKKCGIKCDDLHTAYLVSATRDGVPYEGTVVGGPGCIWAGTIFAADESGQVEVTLAKTERRCGFTVKFEPNDGSSALRNDPVGAYHNIAGTFNWTGIEVS